MHSFIRKIETKSMKLNVNKRSQAQGRKTCVPCTCAGSSLATDIKEWRLGAAGHCFIKILAEESAVVEKAKRDSGNFRKAIQDKREHLVVPYFKSTAILHAVLLPLIQRHSRWREREKQDIDHRCFQKLSKHNHSDLPQDTFCWKESSSRYTVQM